MKQIRIFLALLIISLPVMAMTPSKPDYLVTASDGVDAYVGHLDQSKLGNRERHYEQPFINTEALAILLRAKVKVVLLDARRATSRAAPL